MDRVLAKFINFNFYLCLIPFRVELVKTKNSYGEPVQYYRLLQGHFVQRLFSTTILVLDILQGIFLTRGAYWGKVVLHPSVIFLIWKTIHNSLILGLFWGCTFWKKRKQSDFYTILKHLLRSRKLHSDENYTENFVDDAGQRNKRKTLKSVIGWTLLVSFGLIIPIMIEFVRLFNADGLKRLPTVKDNFRVSSAQVLFDLALHKNHTYISPQDFTSVYFSISVVYVILRTIGKVLLNMAHILAFLIAVTFHSEVKRLYGFVFTTKPTLKNIIQHYLRLRRLVHVLNNVNRPILLCLVSASVPLFVLRVIEAWDTNQISIKFFVLLRLIQFLIIVSISAEANDKALLIQSQMLAICHERDDKAWAGHIFRTNLGLDAGRFVAISYSFIGSMFSAYLSYAIMLLQIQPCQK